MNMQFWFFTYGFETPELCGCNHAPYQQTSALQKDVDKLHDIPCLHFCLVSRVFSFIGFLWNSGSQTLDLTAPTLKVGSLKPCIRFPPMKPIKTGCLSSWSLGRVVAVKHLVHAVLCIFNRSGRATNIAPPTIITIIKMATFLFP